MDKARSKALSIWSGDMEEMLAFQSSPLPGIVRRACIGHSHATDSLRPRLASSSVSTGAPHVTLPVCALPRQSTQAEQQSFEASPQVTRLSPIAGIVLICGFETFNLSTYKAAANAVAPSGINVTVVTDVDVSNQSETVTAALKGADIVLCSLIFDYDQVEWLSSQLPPTASVFVFESALELMALTRVGSFSMQAAADGKASGMPDGLRFILRKLGLIGREEDKLAGYLAMLKNAPRLLSMVPGQKARDLRNWLTVYSYWNAGGTNNIVAMLNYITKEVLQCDVTAEIAPVLQIPNVGLLHPLHNGYFEHPAMYVEWYHQTFPEREHWPHVAVLLYRKHVVSGLRYIPQLVTWFEEAGLVPIPVFITGVEAHIIVRDYLTSEFKEQARARGDRVYGSNRRGKTAHVDAVVSTIGFPLVGGPAGSMAGGRNADVGQLILKQLNVPYTVAAPLLIQDLQSWKEKGVAGLQSVVLYSLPEIDGAIDTVCVGGLIGEEVHLLKDRVDRLTGRLRKWMALRQKKNAEKRVAIILYGFPPSIGATGTAALLNVPESLSLVLQKLKSEGYDVGDGDKLSPKEFLEMVKESDDVMIGGKLTKPSLREMMNGISTVASQDVKEWLGPLNTARIESSWKTDMGSPDNIKTVDQTHLLGGVQMGNVWIGVQPPLGIVGDPMRLMFERDLTPHPQYAAFYRWLEKGLQADAVIHLGMHGTYEWLPGNPLGNTQESWSDILMGNLPNLYIYAANNPSESSLAKRRGYATIISHNVPPYGRTSMYGQLEEVKNLIWEFNEAMQASVEGERLEELQRVIEEKVVSSGLNVDLGFDPSEQSVVDYVGDVSMYIKTLEARLFSSGLHVLGRVPDATGTFGFVEAILGEDEETVPEAVRKDLARAIVASLVELPSTEEYSSWGDFDLTPYDSADVVTKARLVVEKLSQTGNELKNIVRGLNGEFIEALPGGDVLRDGVSVLPTGSNIHALDPYRLPSAAAFLTGRAISERLIQTHRDANRGQYPETVAVPLWGLDNIKTKGESVGIALGLLGAEPVRDGTGRVVRFELIDIEKLGRPRVDVLLNLSGIFRDSFEHVVALLDDVCRRAADAEDESTLDNFVKKHAKSIAKEGDDVDGGARLFSNPSGDYGSMVSEQVAESTWEDGDELASTYVNRNAYVYGRDTNGRRDEKTFKKMLSTTSRVIQQIDSVEYGLSDIQEYYANTGALARAARVESRNENVGVSIVESFGAVKADGSGRDVKELDQVLRMELRTRLLNPQWADKMLSNGTGGAFEVSTRMTALIGWGGTSGFGDDFVFNQAAERYFLDEKNRELLRESPEAYRNVLSRFIEAAGRGIWQNPDPDMIERLRDELEEVDSEIEGV